MTTQIRTVPVRMRFLISVPSCAHAQSSVCACVFHQFRTTLHGLLVCRVRNCVFDRLKEGCFRSSFAVWFVDSWLLDFSPCQMR